MVSNQQKFFVVGATGQQGRAVTQSLIRQGYHVRALGRKAKQHSERAEVLKNLGVEIVLGDMTDQASLVLAMSGVEGVLAMTTFFEEGLDVEVQQGVIIAEAAMGSDMAAMFRWFNEVGYCGDIQDFRTRFGIPLTSFSEYLERVDWLKS